MSKVHAKDIFNLFLELPLAAEWSLSEIFTPGFLLGAVKMAD